MMVIVGGVQHLLHKSVSSFLQQKRQNLQLLNGSTLRDFHPRLPGCVRTCLWPFPGALGIGLASSSSSLLGGPHWLASQGDCEVPSTSAATYRDH